MLAVRARAGVADISHAVVLQGTARTAYEALRAGATRDGIATLLFNAGARSREEAQRDADRFLADLRSRGLHESEGDGELAIRTAERAAPVTSPENGSRAPSIEGEDLIALIREVMGRGLRLRFVARGHSMRPLIPDQSTLEIAPRRFSDLRLGEVALYSVGRRHLVAHRVVRARSSTITASGDSCTRIDQITEEGFLGIVTACARASGRWVSISSGWRRYVGLLGAMLYGPARDALRAFVIRPLRRTYGRRSRLRRSLRLVVAFTSRRLQALERVGRRLRRRLDILHAALLDAEERHEQRLELYAQRAAELASAEAADAPVELTLLEDSMFRRHAPEPGRALVLGCGPGRESVALAVRGHRVTCLDDVEEMLEQAQRRGRERGVDLTCVRGRAHDFELGEARFDLVTVFSALYNTMPRPWRVSLLQSCKRHLAPGGRVFVTFLSAYHPRGDPSPHRGLLEAINPDHEDGDLMLEGEVVHVFRRLDELFGEVQEAGLEVETVTRDQRAHWRQEGRVPCCAVLRRPAGHQPASSAS